MIENTEENPEELADNAVAHCYVCGPMERFTQLPDLPKDLRNFLFELWWYHEDMNDNIECYYALERARLRK